MAYQVQMLPDLRKRGWPSQLAIVHDSAMATLFLCLFCALRAALRSRTDLVLEDLALRQQSGQPAAHLGPVFRQSVIQALWFPHARHVNLTGKADAPNGGIPTIMYRV